MVLILLGCVRNTCLTNPWLYKYGKLMRSLPKMASNEIIIQVLAAVRALVDSDEWTQTFVPQLTEIASQISLALSTEVEARTAPGSPRANAVDTPKTINELFLIRQKPVIKRMRELVINLFLKCFGGQI